MAARKAASLILLILLMGVGSMALIGGVAAQDFGTNWTATFYNNTTLTDPAVAVIPGVPAINFDWGTGVPIINGVAVAGVGADNFSARFSGTQNFALSGTYTFTVNSDDGVRVFIDGALVYNQFVPQESTPRTFQATVNAGLRLVTVEYFEGIDKAVIRLNWGLTGSPVTAGPSPTAGPTATAAPTGLPPIPAGALTGTVIRAPVLIVRGGPSAYADRLGSILRGQTYAIVGRDENARWFLLQLSGYQGWVNGFYLFINSNEFNAPVVSSFGLQGDPAAISGVVAVAEGTVRLRRSPTIYSDQIGRVTWGGAVAITGRTRSGEWWRVIWKGTEGWVASVWFEIKEGELASVPIVDG